MRARHEPDPTRLSRSCLVLDLVGTGRPPPVDYLAVLTEREPGAHPESAGPSSEIFLSKRSIALDAPGAARAAAENGTRSFADLRVDAVVERNMISVDVAGPQTPTGIADIVRGVTQATKHTGEVMVWFADKGS